MRLAELYKLLMETGITHYYNYNTYGKEMHVAKV